MNRRTALVGWLASETVSLTGTRVSMVAIPWFVLSTTGSAAQTGLVAFAEMAPYVLMKAAAGPWVDRLGARRICIGADLASVAVVGAIPLLHALDALALPLLLVLVAVAGALRGPSDGARHALVPHVTSVSGAPLSRVTGLAGAVERLASTVGAAVAGIVVAWLGAAPALVVDAASFALSAVLLAVTVPAPPGGGRPASGGYLAELGEGWRYLRGDRVLLAITVMIGITNLLDAAYASVLVPVWADDSGRGATAIGWLFAVFSGAAVLGSVVAAAYAERLPRRTTYTVAFLLLGLPRFLVLALDLPMSAILGYAAVSGLLCGFVNPILGAVIFERIPQPLVGRVTSLNTALCWAGIPFGGLAGGLAVAGLGLGPALVLAGTLYLLASLMPLRVPAWREIDARPVEVSASARGTTG